MKVTVDTGRVSVTLMILSTVSNTVEGASVSVSRIVLSIVRVTGLGVTVIVLVEIES